VDDGWHRWVLHHVIIKALQGFSFFVFESTSSATKDFVYQLKDTSHNSKAVFFMYLKAPPHLERFPHQVNTSCDHQHADLPPLKIKN
jgi:hypothetical protein